MTIKKPNLPQNKVSLAVVGEEFSQIISSLEKLGIRCVKLKKNQKFNKYEGSHADLRVCHLGDNKLVLYREDSELAEELEKEGFEIVFAENDIDGKYPKSAALNVLQIGKFILLNEKCVDKKIIDFAKKKEVIQIKQGYCRCATCIVNENAVITSDVSVYRALSDKMSVLLISSGNISLADTDEGMIGGSSFLIDKNKLAFCGNIELHPDYIRIKEFLESQNTEYICLTQDRLVDIGTAVILKCSKI